MGRIVTLEVFRKGREDRVRLGLEDGGAHDFDAELAVKFQWSRGLVFNEAQWRTWLMEAERLEARRALLAHLTLRKKSAEEARRWLIAKGYSETASDAAVEIARERDFLDDRAYAEGIVKRRTKSAPMGIRALQHELETRGIAPTDAAPALAPFEGFASQREQAMELARERFAKLKDLPQEKAARRLADFLARKGYEEEIVIEVVEEVTGDLDSNREN